MTKTRTQITGLGPLMPDGSRQIFDKEPKPFIATKVWLDAQISEPSVGDYLDIGEDRSVTLVGEETVSAARGMRLAPPTDAPEVQKKTDGVEGSPVGSAPSPYKYRAKPVEVDAFEIVSVAEEKNADGSLHLDLSNGTNVVADAAMLARITPRVGDYWVVQTDGYAYLNPEAVFVRKYEPITE